MKPLDLPAVTRVHDETGSHIEPPLGQHWDEPTKLAWHAAAVAHETGLTIAVHPGAVTVEQGGERHEIGGMYALTVGRTGISSMSFRHAWTYLNGVRIGADAVRHQEVR